MSASTEQLSERNISTLLPGSYSVMFHQTSRSPCFATLALIFESACCCTSLCSRALESCAPAQASSPREMPTHRGFAASLAMLRRVQCRGGAVHEGLKLGQQCS